jgi:hypothetical protein
LGGPTIQLVAITKMAFTKDIFGEQTLTRLNIELGFWLSLFWVASLYIYEYPKAEHHP